MVSVTFRNTYENKQPLCEKEMMIGDVVKWSSVVRKPLPKSVNTITVFDRHIVDILNTYRTAVTSFSCVDGTIATQAIGTSKDKYVLNKQQYQQAFCSIEQVIWYRETKLTSYLPARQPSKAIFYP